MVPIESLVGQRVLRIIKSGYNSKIEEVRVLEISPSGNWMCTQNMYGTKIWEKTSDFVPLEILEIKPKGRIPVSKQEMVE